MIQSMSESEDVAAARRHDPVIRPRVMVRCAICGRTVAGRVPCGGDGSERLPVRHKRHGGSGEWCEGHHRAGTWIG